MTDPNLKYLDTGFLPTDRVILHADCNSYFASVESIGHPEYTKVPMAVCGDPKSRHGIILAKNELAKAYHIETAETIYSALKKCPNLLLLPAHHKRYSEICRQINAIYQQYTDLVEPFSIDESFLDVTGSRHLFGTGEQIADKLRERVYTEIGITISVGVSFNMTFAKMGSDYKKPNATTLISRENYQRLLWPLPVEDFLFVGKSGAQLLKASGIYTIGDLAQADPGMLTACMGKSGLSLLRAARGEDTTPVHPADYEEQPKSISHSVTFDHDLTDESEIRRELTVISDYVGTRLRRHKLYAELVQIQIKDPNLKLINRQRQLGRSTNATRDIREAATELLLDNWTRGKPIRMLTVGVGGLGPEGMEQLSMFSDTKRQEKDKRLDAAVDSIRERFGPGSLRLGQ